jgi:hypothetical protein
MRIARSTIFKRTGKRLGDNKEVVAHAFHTDAANAIHGMF